jgi:hypothetical protein
VSAFVSVIVIGVNVVHDGSEPVTAERGQTAVSLAVVITTCEKPERLIHDRVIARRKIPAVLNRRLFPV